jgi:hypothetical protein
MRATEIISFLEEVTALLQGPKDQITEDLYWKTFKYELGLQDHGRYKETEEFYDFAERELIEIQDLVLDQIIKVKWDEIIKDIK